MESAGFGVGGGQNGNGGWGAPGHQPGVVGGGPDWAAMAEAHEREGRRKRKRWIAVGVAGALALGGAAAGAVAWQGSGRTQPTASGPASQPTSTKPTGTKSATPPRGSKDLRLGASDRLDPVDGHSGPALTTHGVHDGYAEVKSVVLDTAASFTVSAVVRNDAPAETRAVVSQGSDGFFSFYLGREDYAGGAHNQWVFKVQTAAATGKSVLALSPTPAAAGRWTTLTGVYDASAKAISLYVDGVLAQTTPVPGILVTTGPIEIGRARYKAHWVDFWDGAIADVQVWDRPLPGDKVAQLARTGSAGVPVRGAWIRP
ncbi:LamG domain-containing protein [Kitasatospora sp. McL0602]|uniref:LamG domain-containing protein n=1 Tax=Kitasatospora sp. McL0602 TaxID=3439530 RepID=UPI003F88D1C3